MRLKTTLFLFINLLYFSQVEAQSCNADFETRNGLAVVQLDTKAPGGWDSRAISGASGGRALYYAGSNFFNNPPGNSVATYQLRVNSAGTYRVILRNRIGIISNGPEPATSEHNDLWLKIQAAEFYGQRDGRRLYPKGSGRTPNPAGASGSGYLKVYTNQLGWNWNTFTNDGPGYVIYARFNSAGTYNVQIGGRSNGFIVDKLALYKEGSVTASQAQNAAATPCDGSSNPPPPPPPPAENQAPTVSITNPDNGEQFDEGDSFSVQLSANDPDGNIVSYVISVNGAVVDSDSSSYSPYQFRNAQPGTYAIRATVTDNDGATDTSTVNITVDEENTPPPPPPAENVAPVVSISNPANGASFDEGSSIPISLAASDSDGSIAKHEISVNGTVVDTDGSTYTIYSITQAQPGTYAIRATVTDDDGATATTAVNITVDKEATPPEEEEEEEEEEEPTPVENEAPTVVITDPLNGGLFKAGDALAINLTANDADGSIATHEIFVNGTKVDTDGANYTPYVIESLTAGDFEITATVTDNDGAKASSSVNVVVSEEEEEEEEEPTPVENEAPTVAFVNLTDGQSVESGTTVSVDVDASDADGSIVKYQIFVNGLLVDTDGSFFTPHPIRNVEEGAYEIKVTVTDNDGATASETITVIVGDDPNAEISFNLLGGSADINIGVLSDGATISASKTGDVNIQANVPMTAESVRFILTGTQTRSHIENVVPYTLFGDFEGDIYSGSLKSGAYTLEVIAFSEDLGAGDVVATKTINFTVGLSTSDKSFLFPNPVSSDGKVSVRLPEGSSGQFEYSISNSLGVQVESGTFDASAAQRDVQLSLPNIGRQVQGVYYMTLQSNGSRETIPLIRE